MHTSFLPLARFHSVLVILFSSLPFLCLGPLTYVLIYVVVQRVGELRTPAPVAYVILYNALRAAIEESIIQCYRFCVLADIDSC